MAKSEADVLINSVLIKRKACILGRYLASFLQVEFVGCWSATESDACTGQVRGFVWWSLEAFGGLITLSLSHS